MNLFTKIFASIAIVAMMFFAVPSFSVIAQKIDPCAEDATRTGCGSNVLKAFGDCAKSTPGEIAVCYISSAASIIIAILAALSVLYLLFNAYKMMTDSGDGKNWGAGLAGVKFALGGLVIALLAFGIVSFVTNLVIKK
ncbi:MAG: hypothetical protein ACRCXZ_02595 [Patescibacteria group bacterium]